MALQPLVPADRTRSTRTTARSGSDADDWAISHQAAASFRASPTATRRRTPTRTVTSPHPPPKAAPGRRATAATAPPSATAAAAGPRYAAARPTAMTTPAQTAAGARVGIAGPGVGDPSICKLPRAGQGKGKASGRTDRPETGRQSMIWKLREVSTRRS